MITNLFICGGIVTALEEDAVVGRLGATPTGLDLLEQTRRRPPPR
jgi:hypothetical protein